MFLTRHYYAWSLDQLVSGRILLCNAEFMIRSFSTVTADELISVHFTTETLCLLNIYGN